MYILTSKPQSFYHNESKLAFGYQNPLYLKQAQRKQVAFYDGKTLCKKHEPVYKETLQKAKESRLKMKEKMKEHDDKPYDYSQLNKVYNVFVPRKEFFKERKYFSQISETFAVKPVKNVPKQLPKRSKAKKFFDGLKRQVTTLEEVAKDKTTITVSNWDDSLLHKIKEVFLKEKKPVVDSHRAKITNFENALQKEIVEMTKIFDLVEEESLEKCIECENLEAELSKQKENEKIICDESWKKHDAPLISKLHNKSYEINDLKAQLQDKSITVSELKKLLTKLKGKSVETNFLTNDLTNPVTAHSSTNAEKERNSNVISPRMFRIDSEPVNSYFRNKKIMYKDYLDATKKHVLQDLLHQASALRPLDRDLEYAFKIANIIQEFLHYACVSCPSAYSERVNWAPATCLKTNDKPRVVKSQETFVKVYDRIHSLKYRHVFGALCYPTNDSKDLEKLKPKADIAIFIGYSPSKKSHPINNKRTRLIMERIHDQFDELTVMASEQSSSGHAPYTPPTRNQLDILFQPMFVEYFKEIPKTVSLDNSDATRQDAPSSTIIDQDAPLPTTTLITEETITPVTSDDVEEKIQENPNAKFNSDKFTNSFAPPETGST
ncbi:hypothetical protein Tco_0232977 [Tanacetum coccineum]